VGPGLALAGVVAIFNERSLAGEPMKVLRPPASSPSAIQQKTLRSSTSCRTRAR